MKNLLFCFLFICAACGTSKNTSVLMVATPLAANAEVEVIGKGQTIPNGAKLLGHIKIGDSGLTSGGNCTYDKVVADAVTQSRAMGGNLMQITEHKEPNILFSNCHRLFCDVYLKP